MVCNRCIMVVKAELEKLSLQPDTVVLGEIDLKNKISLQEKEILGDRLRPLGFEIIDDKKTRLIEMIKTTVVALIHTPSAPVKVKYSEYLSNKLHQDYSTLSKLFSEVQGTTLEHYIITQRIEKVKGLLVYDELSLSEIADQLNYSSVSHLSKQFKKITGLTPTHYRQVKEKKRLPLDKV